MSAKPEPVSLADAALRTGMSESDLLWCALRGELPLAVWAHSQPAARGEINEQGFFDLQPKGACVVRDTWLYMDPGYIRRYLNAGPTDAFPLGLWRSTPDGAADLFLTPKLAVSRQDLHVAAADVSRLRKSEGRNAANSSTARARRTTLQVAIDAVTEKYWPAWKPGKPAAAAKDVRKWIRGEYARSIGKTFSEQEATTIERACRPDELREAQKKAPAPPAPAAIQRKKNRDTY